MAGSATVDIILIGHKVNFLDGGHTARFQTEDYKKDFPVTDGPIVKGGKFQTTVDTKKGADGLDHRNRSGGGGYNSAKANSRISREYPVEIKYIDVATPNHMNTDRLDHWGINYFFLNKRRVQFNIVASYDGDKIIIKGPLEPAAPLDRSAQEDISRFLQNADGLLINSIKDEEFARMVFEIAKERGIPTFFGVTTSPSHDFALTHTIPNGPSVANYEDVATLNGENPYEIVHLEASEVIDATADLVKNMQRGGTLGDYPFIATIGAKGVIIRTPNGDMRHVRLAQPYSDRVNEHLNTDLRGALGGGDYFVGGFFDQMMSALLSPNRVHPARISPDDLEIMVRRSSLTAIRAMNYSGPEPFLTSFDSRRL